MLRGIREHNALLFAFVLERSLESAGKRFARTCSKPGHFL